MDIGQAVADYAAATEQTEAHVITFLYSRDSARTAADLIGLGGDGYYPSRSQVVALQQWLHERMTELQTERKVREEAEKLTLSQAQREAVQAVTDGTKAVRVPIEQGVQIDPREYERLRNVEHMSNNAIAKRFGLSYQRLQTQMQKAGVYDGSFGPFVQTRSNAPATRSEIVESDTNTTSEEQKEPADRSEAYVRYITLRVPLGDDAEHYDQIEDATESIRDSLSGIGSALSHIYDIIEHLFGRDDTLNLVQQYVDRQLN